MRNILAILLLFSFIVYSICLQCQCNNKICPCRHHNSFIESNRIIFKADNKTSNI